MGGGIESMDGSYPRSSLSKNIGYILYPFIALGFISTLGGILYQTFDQRYGEYQKIYKNAIVIVDTNKDGTASEDEWLNAYKKAGILNDVLENARTKENLEKLIANSEK